MKKLSIYLTSFMAVLVLTACMGDRNDEVEDVEENGAENMNYQENDTDMDMNDNNEANQANLDVADKAADSIEKMDEVDGATVLVTDHKAYAAVDLKEGVEVTEDLKKKMEEKVMGADTSVEKVYISEDPEFTTQMKDYADRVRAGEPVEGIFDEFGDVVRSVFPNS